MPREHGESGEFVETVALEDVAGVFDAVDGPVILSADVADALGCSRETARRKLDELQERGDLERRKVSRRVLYWRVDEDGPEDAADAVEAIDPGETPAEPSTPTDGVSRPESDTVPNDTPDSLGELKFPTGRDREECEAAILAARDHLREHGGATMRELVAAIMPEHPVGYDAESAVAKVEAGERFRGAWWRKVVKPGLEALEDVESPPPGGNDWTYSGGCEAPDAEQPGQVYDPTEEF